MADGHHLEIQKTAIFSNGSTNRQEICYGDAR